MFHQLRSFHGRPHAQILGAMELFPLALGDKGAHRLPQRRQRRCVIGHGPESDCKGASLVAQAEACAYVPHSPADRRTPRRSLRPPPTHPCAEGRAATITAAEQLSRTSDNSRVARPESSKDVGDACRATTPFEDSGRATQPGSLRASGQRAQNGADRASIKPH